MPDAPRPTNQTADFLKAAHRGPLTWRAMCLSLQRQARGLPAIYPSALSAAVATPESERVYEVAALRRGMVAYSDDPNDSNPYGHIYFIAGWDGPKTNPANCWTWTNDMARSGGVDLVRLSTYRANWGDNFQFGATWLNGYNFAEFDKPPTPDPQRATLGGNYEHAIEDVKKALRFHEKKGHTGLVKGLRKDLDRMTKRMERRS